MKNDESHFSCQPIFNEKGVHNIGYRHRYAQYGERLCSRLIIQNINKKSRLNYNLTKAME